ERGVHQLQWGLRAFDDRRFSERVERGVHQVQWGLRAFDDRRFLALAVFIRRVADKLQVGGKHFEEFAIDSRWLLEQNFLTFVGDAYFSAHWVVDKPRVLQVSLRPRDPVVKQRLRAAW